MPVAYLLILCWVVCANVLAKLFGPLLVEATSGWVKQLLSRPLNITVTGDSMIFHLFGKQILQAVNHRLFFELLSDLGRLPGGYALALQPAECSIGYKEYHPARYWSGCPPNV
ncbi:MAG TPA: hypothetical protein V6C99_11745 [Oculatellaceae cyanobacterium]